MKQEELRNALTREKELRQQMLLLYDRYEATLSELESKKAELKKIRILKVLHKISNNFICFAVCFGWIYCFFIVMREYSIWLSFLVVGILALLSYYVYKNYKVVDEEDNYVQELKQDVDQMTLHTTFLSKRLNELQDELEDIWMFIPECLREED